MSPSLIDQDGIVRESIIENKENLKSFWEQRMQADKDAKASEIKKSIRPVYQRSSSNITSNRDSESSSADSVSSLDDQPSYVEERNVKEEKKRLEREIELRQMQKPSHELRMEDRIAQEIQDVKMREEELRQLRISSANIIPQDSIEESTQLVVAIQDVCSEYGSDDKDDKEPSLDGSNRYRDYSQRRTQSMESVSSGLSSGSGTTRGSDNTRDGSQGDVIRDLPLDVPRRRHITVKPYDDPENDESPAYKSNDKETPIEREIRLAREREEEYRRTKGLTTSAPEPAKKLVLGRKDALENDTRDVQHRLATNRIQQEIEEDIEKEIQLKTEGRVQTTSNERVDGIVTRFTQLAQDAMLDGEKIRKIRKSTSVTSLTSLSIFEEPENVRTEKRSSLQPPKFTNVVRQRAFLQRFMTNKSNVSVAPMSPIITTPDAQPFSMPLDLDVVPRERPNYTRNGFKSAQEKIQSELQADQKREAEFRMAHAHILAQSQPNLLDIGGDDDRQEKEEVGASVSDDDSEERRIDMNGLKSAFCTSTPNLTQQVQQAQAPKGRRRRFELLEHWETRIQNS